MPVGTLDVVVVDDDDGFVVVVADFVAVGVTLTVVVVDVAIVAALVVGNAPLLSVMILKMVCGSI